MNWCCKGSSLFLTYLRDCGIWVDMCPPLRIEYLGAYYHVMNRGLTGQKFYSKKDLPPSPPLLGVRMRQPAS